MTFPTPQFRGACLLAAILISSTVVSADSEPAIEILYEPQIVTIGVNPVLFSGSALIPATGRSSGAAGFLAFQSRTGATASLRIIFAKRLSAPTSRRGKPLLIIAEDVEADPLAPPSGRFVFGVLTADATRAGRDQLDLAGIDLLDSGSDRIRFTGDSTRTRVEHEFPTHDFGQIPTPAVAYSPLQTVQPINRGDPLEFGAIVLIGRENEATGIVFAPLSQQGGDYEVCFGAVFPHAVLGVQLLILGVLPDAADIDGLLRATVQPVAANPDCQIWDLVNGSTGEVTPARHTATFDAQTVIVFP